MDRKLLECRSEGLFVEIEKSVPHSYRDCRTKPPYQKDDSQAAMEEIQGIRTYDWCRRNRCIEGTEGARSR